jgi:hypothetical protein
MADGVASMRIEATPESVVRTSPNPNARSEQGYGGLGHLENILEVG